MITQETARELVEALDEAISYVDDEANRLHNETRMSAYRLVSNRCFQLSSTLTKARKEMEDATQNAKN